MISTNNPTLRYPIYSTPKRKKQEKLNVSLSVSLAIAVGWFTLPHSVTRRARTEAPLLLLIIRRGCYPAGFSSPFRPRATYFPTTPPAPPPPVTQTHRRLIRLVGPQKLYPITFLRPLRAIQPASQHYLRRTFDSLRPRIYHFAPTCYFPMVVFHEPFLGCDDFP